jgi:hypothetical protein
MKRIIPLLLGLGAYASTHADALVAIPSPIKSERKFRFIKATNPADSIALADIVVAYEDPDATADFGKNADGSKTTMRQFLTDKVFKATSLELFKASGGAVQLGRIVIVRKDENLDADIVILKSCQSGMARPGDGAGVCADAITGGYLGLGWWLPTLPQTNGKPVFDQKYTGGTQISNVGANIRVAWGTLIKYPSTTLIHEFGHYLFGMRDEYEGQTFEQAAGEDLYNKYFTNRGLPKPLTGEDTKGVVIDGGLYAPSADAADWGPAKKFKGYAMSYLANYSTNGKTGYSPRELSITDAEVSVGEAGSQRYGVLEQIASVSTRGELTKRYGGMWSLETAIRTSKCAGDLECTYTPTAKAEAAHVKDSVVVDVYGEGSGNFFLLDNSGSMQFAIKGSNLLGLNRWDVGLNFFGGLTNVTPGTGALQYPTGSKFGFYRFSTNVKKEVAYGTTNIGLIGNYTRTYVPGTPNKQLDWEFRPGAFVRDDSGTNIVGALDTANYYLSNDPDKPFRRNVILVSDGKQELYPWQTIPPFTGDEAKKGGYRVFAVSLDNELKDDAYGTLMQNLAINSQTWDGEKGEVFFTNGDNSAGKEDESSRAVSTLNGTLDAINTARNGYKKRVFDPTTLFQDQAQEFPVVTDAGMTNLHFSFAWSGTNAPKVWLFEAGGAQHGESNSYGITYTQKNGVKSFDVDLSKFPTAGTWRMKVQLMNSANTVTIYPSIATKSSKLKVSVVVKPDFISRTGSLPIDVVVQDRLPLEGLNVSAVLLSRKTGVSQLVPLTWNGSSYSGVIAGMLQPGISNLTVTVSHPGSNVWFAQGENNLPAALRTQYPAFATRVQSQEIWVPGAQTTKSLTGLEAWTAISENRSNVTALKLFIKNGTSVPLTGLRARYFFSLTEAPGALPGFSASYLAGGSNVTVGTVLGRPGLAYVQYDFAGKTLQPGQSSSNGVNGGEGGYILKQNNWGGVWEVSNDYSFRGLKPYNAQNIAWAANSFVNIYDAAGNLISGNPDMDPPGNASNGAPVVKLVLPDLLVAGSPANLLVRAVDPEKDPLRYKWSINGVVVSGTDSAIAYTFSTPGTYTVKVEVSDGDPTVAGVNVTTVTGNVVVQPTSGACTVANSKFIGLASSNKTFGLSAGANCFVIKDSTVMREWKWSKVQFQTNSDNGVAMTGLSVATVPTGTATNLSGYSQIVPLADPGAGKNLYVKIQASSARTVRFNWWLQ